MGYVVARFFIVHSWNASDIAEARSLACDVFSHAVHLVGPIMEGVVNSECGFIVWTSGSKLAWGDDEKHVESIDELIAKMSAMAHPPRWVRVNSGEEVGDLDAEHAYDGDYSHTYERAKIGPAGGGS